VDCGARERPARAPVGKALNAEQNLNVLWGKLLRIDDDTPYAVPKDNPFAKADKPRLMSLFGITEQGFTANKIRSRPEIWAHGLRKLLPGT
jgi:hypothetical protein